MPNRLARETSPYLAQHANNPVDWFPWGKEALDRARELDRPIFLSIGYSACHWCHVMEHESFENEGIARLLNEHFVPIKVDREERPDLDQIYMNAVQILTGRGGWPMSVFLTPRLEPFFGGTYWPPTSQRGMPGFDEVLRAVADAWSQRREQVTEQATKLTAHVQQIGRMATLPGEFSPRALHQAAAWFERAFDSTHGGFGQSPKFPHPIDLRLLLRLWKREPREALLNIVTVTLDRMAAGGIYDHLGGGFHRYSVDERWLVPHFEKMLYDNGLLTLAYLEAYQATQEERYARVVRETLDHLLRDMRDPQGGFYSTLDADSEGEEGKYYVWTPAELAQVLGEDPADVFGYVYDVTPRGNFEGHSILNLPRTFEQSASALSRNVHGLEKELAQSRAKLLAVRQQRIAPGRDEKVLVSWNALAIDALAQSAAVLGEARYLEAAAQAADFLLARLRLENGRLAHSWCAGEARFPAYLDDYSYLANALVSLYEASFDPRWIDEAITLADELLAGFSDRERGGFYFTADDHEALIARNKDVQDSSVPSGNGMAAMALVRLGKLCGRRDYLEAAERTFAALAEPLRQSPSSSSQLLLAWDFYQGPTPELVLVAGKDTQTASELLAGLRRRFLPNKIVVYHVAGDQGAASKSRALEPMLAGKTADDVEPRLYLCENFACQAPLTGAPDINQRLDKLATPGSP